MKANAMVQRFVEQMDGGGLRDALDRQRPEPVLRHNESGAAKGYCYPQTALRLSGVI